jgi:hypothetical protein
MSDKGARLWPEIATAIATTGTWLATWLTYRYYVHSADPIVECDEPKWTIDGKAILVHITVRNRSAMAQTISTVEVRKPKGSILSLPDNPTLSPAKKLDLSWLVISPVGTVSQLPLPLPRALDETTLTLLLEPPRSFVSGKLRIVLTVLDKSVTARHRRFAISKFIQAAPQMRNAATIKKN